MSRGLLAVLAVALGLRLLLVVATPDFAPFGDAADYDRYATWLAGDGQFPPTQIAEPGGATAYRPPAYPLLLAAAYEVTGLRFTVGRALAALLGTAAVLLLYLLVARLYDRRLALWSAGVAAVAPPLVALSGSLLSESLFVPLVLALALAVAAHRERSRVWLAIAAGGLLGLVVLTKSNGLLLALPLVLGLAHGSGRRRALAPAVALLATAVVLTPWVVRNAATFDRFLPLGTQSGFTMAGQWNDEATQGGAFHTVWLLPQTVPAYADRFAQPGVDEGDLDAQLRAQAVDYARGHPGAVLAAAVTNATRTFDVGPGHVVTSALAWKEMGVPSGLVGVLRVSSYLLLVLGVIGAVVLGRRRGTLWLWLMPAIIFASGILWLSSPRYATPLFAFAAIPVAAALLRVRVRAAPA